MDLLSRVKCIIWGHPWSDWHTVYIYPTRRCERCWNWQREGNRIYNFPKEQMIWRAWVAEKLEKAGVD